MKQLKRNKNGFVRTRKRGVGGVAIDVASWSRGPRRTAMFQIAVEERHSMFLSPRGMRQLYAAIGRHLVDIDGGAK